MIMCEQILVLSKLRKAMIKNLLESTLSQYFKTMHKSRQKTKYTSQNLQLYES